MNLATQPAPQSLAGLPRSVVAAMAAGTLLFVAVAIAGFRSLQEVESDSQLRSQARQGLLLSSQLLSQVKDIETGQRGFLLTGKAEYLQPYLAASTGYSETLRRLRDEVGHMVSAATALAALETQLERRVALAREAVELRQRGALDAPMAATLVESGKHAMDALRLRFLALDGLLQTEIERADARLQQVMRWARILALGMTSLGAGMLLLAFLLLRREQQRRVEAELALLHANAELEARVRLRTQDLQQARSELARFAADLDRHIEAERGRLAREVHDQLGQVFTSLKLGLGRSLTDAQAAAKQSARNLQLLDQGIATARRIAAELRPPLLDDFGLAAALAQHARQFSDTSGLSCEVQIEHADRLTRQQALQLFRITQEALTNVARHAQAQHVWIEGNSIGDHYLLAIEDDGRGLVRSPEGPRSVPAVAGSMGLLNMRERAALAGGRLGLEQGRNGGLRIEVRLPLTAAGSIDADSAD
jgi:protein-histidine pros-kinase